jgi:hypothetical protein
MNKHVMALAAALVFGITGPVLAASDSQTVDKTSQEKTVAPERPGEAARPSPGARCPVEPLVLLLDHGPRALSTPHLNRMRTERHEAQVKPCAGVGK